LEEDKAADVSLALGVSIDTQQYVQSHTPFAGLAPRYADLPVLVAGQWPCQAKAILQRYGFRRVVTTAELQRQDDRLWPFYPRAEDLAACSDAVDPIVETPNPTFAAAFVTNDPQHWAMDLQILLDLLRSDDGAMGTDGLRSDGETNNVTLYFSASDLEFSSAWPVPRLGQGGFIAALRALWAAKSNTEPPFVLYGKPNAAAFEFADARLHEGRACRLERQYMVGDNPESDIAGANGYTSPRGTQWKSVLVMTGVWDGKSTMSGKAKPDFIAKDVREAVEMIVRAEGVNLKVELGI
jgi:HAD superfamily hydrolase (TIGR01456 family)